MHKTGNVIEIFGMLDSRQTKDKTRILLEFSEFKLLFT